MRYAIYFVPPVRDPLWQVGNHWLGRDPQTGEIFEQAAEDAAVTADPRRYGFHATLKPPFALATGADPVEFESALAEFAKAQRQFEVPGLRVARLDRFVALVPQVSAARLNVLADACVRTFEPFRAPLSDADIARRRSSELSPRQVEYLANWGYPYVFEEFRFHMTLTGPLDPASSSSYEHRLTELFAPVLSPRLTVRELALFIEPAAGHPFRLKRRFPLGSPAKH